MPRPRFLVREIALLDNVHTYSDRGNTGRWFELILCPESPQRHISEKLPLTSINSARATKHGKRQFEASLDSRRKSLRMLRFHSRTFNNFQVVVQRCCYSACPAGTCFGATTNPRDNAIGEATLST